MRRDPICLAVLAFVLAPPAFGQAAAFVEEFDRLDRERWFVSDGWRNGDHQSCDWSADAVTVADGVLRLRLGPSDGGTLQCAEIQSEPRQSFGTYEARLRIPFAAGVNANLFTFIGPPQGLPHGEIDFEFIARDGPTLQTNTFVDGRGGREQLHTVSPPDGWHDVALVWEPGRIRWFLDGVLIREATDLAVPGDEPQKLYLSLWSTATLTGWLGPLTHDFAAAGPLVMEVDRVAYTPPGGECPFAGSILCDG
jgi:endo-1,3-1,4-beta-glycanase ExoK